METYVNKASLEFEIDDKEKEVESNSVTATLLELPTIVKSQSLSIVTIGDEQIYSFVITNPNINAIGNVLFTDIIPTGMTFVPGSFTVNSIVKTPTLTSNTLTYNIASLLSGVTNVSFKVNVSS